MQALLEKIAIISHPSLSSIETEVNELLDEGYHIIKITHHNNKICIIMGLQEEEDADENN